MHPKLYQNYFGMTFCIGCASALCLEARGFKIVIFWTSTVQCLINSFVELGYILDPFLTICWLADWISWAWHAKLGLTGIDSKGQTTSKLLRPSADDSWPDYGFSSAVGPQLSVDQFTVSMADTYSQDYKL